MDINELFKDFVEDINEQSREFIWDNVKYKFDLKGRNLINLGESFSELDFINIDLSGLDLSKVKHCDGMFENCKYANEIKMPDFIGNRVERTAYMFKGCSKLEKINLSSFSPRGAVDARGMFEGCKNLREIDLSNFERNFGLKITHTYSSSLEFDSYRSLPKYTGDFTDMFKGCDSLKKLILTVSLRDKLQDIGELPDCEIIISDLDSNPFHDLDSMMKSVKKLHGIKTMSLDEELIKHYEYLADNPLDFGIGYARVRYIEKMLEDFNSGNGKLMPVDYVFCKSYENEEDTVYIKSFSILDFKGRLKLQAPIFENFKCRTIDLTGVNKYKWVSCYRMFDKCKNLINLNIKELDTSKVEDFSCMFSGCIELSSISTNVLNTDNGENFSYMFHNCTSLNRLDLSNFNVSNGYNFKGMFSYCKGLKELDLSNFNPQYAVSCKEMFYCCENVRIIDLSNFKINENTEVSDMFKNCNNLVTLIIPRQTYEVLKEKEVLPNKCKIEISEDIAGINEGLEVDNEVANGANKSHLKSKLDLNEEFSSTSLFEREEERESSGLIKISNSEDLKDALDSHGSKSLIWNEFKEKLTSDRVRIDLGGAFCDSLITELNLEGFDFPVVDTTRAMFLNCNHLERFVSSKLDTEGVQDMGSMFEGCESLRKLDLTNFNTLNVEDMSNMFLDCVSLDWVCTYGLSLCTVKDMSGMFKNCKSLKDLDLKDLRTGSLENTSEMFKNCKSLVELDLHMLYLEGVENMMGMFEGCSNLKNLKLKNAFIREGIKKLKNTSRMFKNCVSLTDVNLKILNTENVTYMFEMFEGCSSLKELDLSNLSIDKVKDMSYMFFGCSELRRLDLSGFKGNRFVQCTGMFDKCFALEEIVLSRYCPPCIKRELSTALGDRVNIVEV